LPLSRQNLLPVGTLTGSGGDIVSQFWKSFYYLVIILKLFGVYMFMFIWLTNSRTALCDCFYRAMSQWKIFSQL